MEKLLQLFLLGLVLTSFQLIILLGALVLYFLLYPLEPIQFTINIPYKESYLVQKIKNDELIFNSINKINKLIIEKKNIDESTNESLNIDESTIESLNIDESTNESLNYNNQLIDSTISNINKLINVIN